MSKGLCLCPFTQPTKSSKASQQRTQWQSIATTFPFWTYPLAITTKILCVYQLCTDTWLEILARWSTSVLLSKEKVIWLMTCWTRWSTQLKSWLPKKDWSCFWVTSKPTGICNCSMICCQKATVWLNKHLRVTTTRRSPRSMMSYSQTTTNLSQRKKESTLSNLALLASSIGSTLTNTSSLNGQSKINTNQNLTRTSLSLKRQSKKSMIIKQNE